MLTKKKALRITRELFTWLAEHPDKQKQDWPGLAKLKPMSSDCALCQYNEEHGLDCEKDGCLIEWTQEQDKLCLADGSPFIPWFYREDNDDEELSEKALEVVALAVAAETARQRKI